MSSAASGKVRADHLKRNAYLYVRQSTVRQVFENTESTRRQYALRQRAVALGWPTERVVVIDNDQGQSGASAQAREGFKTLVNEVAMGRAGIVLGLEVSRLARNSADWHRLLEICAVSETLILDEDGIYDPKEFNDRLLLGLKGTMSEAELHILRARLRGGILNKARRGELRSRLPIGLLYDPQERVVLDPDRQIRDSVALLFATFRRTGSACGTVKAFRRQGVLFPRRLSRGLQKGEVLWGELDHWRTLQILHNPRYAGAFVFGRTRTRRRADGRVVVKDLPLEQWDTVIRQAHPGYISWDEYEENLRRLRANAQAHGAERRKSPPREGPALLQGMVICGVCGLRMTVRYRTSRRGVAPIYLCQTRAVEHGEQICQSIPGSGIDAAMGDLLVEAMSPVALEVSLAVQREIQVRLEQADRLLRKQVDRARYEAELARRRYMQVDPNNRLVADELEAQWNNNLRAFKEAQEDYEKRKERVRAKLTDKQRARILALATDFPKVWADPNTPQRERKRMARLLLEDVTLIKDGQITAHVRFKGGATRTLRLPVPPSAWQLRQTPSEVVSTIDRLLDDHTLGQILTILNEQGLCSGEGKPFSRRILRRIQQAYGLKTRYDRLRDAGMLTLAEMAGKLGVSRCTVKIWHQHGLLGAYPYNDKSQYLYGPPGKNAPVKNQRKGIYGKPTRSEVHPDRTDEVQYAT